RMGALQDADARPRLGLPGGVDLPEPERHDRVRLRESLGDGRGLGALLGRRRPGPRGRAAEERDPRRAQTADTRAGEGEAEKDSRERELEGNGDARYFLSSTFTTSAGSLAKRFSTKKQFERGCDFSTRTHV